MDSSSTHVSRRTALAGLGSGLMAAAAITGGGGRAGAAPTRVSGVALVGLGKLALGELVPALKLTKRCRLTALVSGHRDKALKVAAQNGVPETNIYGYDSFDRLADNHDVDIVYVVLPNAMHAEYTVRAARAGKHVLCEKPMAVTPAECEQMIAACKAAHRQLAIGYRLHFEPHNLELARITRARELGAPKLVYAAACIDLGKDATQWRLDKKLSGGGSMVDIGIYALQAARTITGEEPIEVSAFVTVTDPKTFRPGVDESMLFTLRFPSGVLAQCASSYAAVTARYAVTAERGVYGLDPALWYRGIRGFRSDGKPLAFDPVNQFAAEMDDFAACVEAGQPTRVPGEEGLRDVRIIEALYRSAAEGKAIRVAT